MEPSLDVVTVSGSATRTVVTGLMNGVQHQFIVTATNSAGVSRPSDMSPPVIPIGPPSPPVDVKATPQLGAVVVRWKAPKTNGGSPLTSYKLLVSPTGRTESIAATLRSTRIDGLDNGVPVTVTVVACNARAESEPSQPSAPVSPAGEPGAVRDIKVEAGDACARVTWQPPQSDNGAPVEKYTVRAVPGGSEVEVPAATTSALVPDLSNGVRYAPTRPRPASSPGLTFVG